MSILNIAIFFPLINAFGHSGIPLAISITLYIEMFILLYILVKKTGHIGGISVLKSIIKLIIASTIGTSIMYTFYKFLEKYLPQSSWYIALDFLASMLLFVFVYIIMLVILKAEEAKTAFFVTKKIIRRIRKRT
jgi:putative peptidoglycan lipid II flippase